MITDPSSFNAANALAFEKIFWTPLCKSCFTVWLSPPASTTPEPLDPHVTTDPLSLRAAKAVSVEKICTIFAFSFEATLLLSPPVLTGSLSSLNDIAGYSLPQVTTEPSSLIAANEVPVEDMELTPARNLFFTFVVLNF